MNFDAHIVFDKCWSERNIVEEDKVRQLVDDLKCTRKCQNELASPLHSAEKCILLGDYGEAIKKSEIV